MFTGGRKWKGFLLMVFVVALLIIGGYIKDQNIIRDLILGLFGILGTSVAVEKFSRQGGGDVKEP